MVKKANPDLFLKGLYILHFDHDGNEDTYECEYLEDDVERMLAFHKKQRLNDAFRESTKTINF
jgi:hypothetical protein